MRLLTALLIPLLLCAVARAQEEEETDELTAFLEGARAKHLDHNAKGLESFTARMSLRRSENENLRRYKDVGGFGYAFTAPEKEEFDFEKTYETLRKGIRDTVRGSWRDITGILCFDLIAKATDLNLTKEAGKTVVAGQLGEFGGIRAVFEGDGALAEVEFVKLDAKYTYFYDECPGGLRVACREVSAGGKKLWRITWDVFKKTNGFSLPSVVEVETDKNTTEYVVVYGTINGAPAHTQEADEAKVKAAVEEFEKGWRKWEDHRKIQEMRTLSEIGSDLVATAIAKRGLKDRSEAVRVAAAEALGILKRACAVPALLSAMKRNVKIFPVYVRVIEALGEIGDRRAVDLLGKDWWNQKEAGNGLAAAKAKIHALGNIRHVTAVDALIDTFFVTKDETVNLFKADLVISLRKLTGVDFGADRKGWKDWWKKNRSTHEFE